MGDTRARAAPAVRSTSTWARISPRVAGPTPHPATDERRYLEIWKPGVHAVSTSVPDGPRRNRSPRRAIDTGMGLERISGGAAGDARSNYDTDLFVPLLDAVGRTRAGVRRGEDAETRLLAPRHRRSCPGLLLFWSPTAWCPPVTSAATFLSSSLLRRAIRLRPQVGDLTEPFLHDDHTGRAR